MMQKYFFAQMRAVQMQIDFGCAYRFVSEHLLYGSEVGASFEKMGGKGMS